MQTVVENAFSVVADAPIHVTSAGRTDAGVHALAQVIHFDTSAVRNAYSWVRGANSNLPDDVAVLWTGEVNIDFHARYSATGRSYHYIILNRPIRPTYLARRVTHEYRPLDVSSMKDAARYLTGEHDFSSFRAADCQAKNPIRTLRQLDINRHADMIHIQAHANAFLHHMVRNIAGVLMTIGAGERKPSWAKEVLDARDRTVGGITAAPDGLYLVSIAYPEILNIPVVSPAFPQIVV